MVGGVGFFKGTLDGESWRDDTRPKRVTGVPVYLSLDRTAGVAQLRDRHGRILGLIRSIEIVGERDGAEN